MKKRMKVIAILILIIVAIIFMEKNVKAFQYGGDIRIEKVWVTESQIEQNRKMQNNRNNYLKYDDILVKSLITGVILCSIIATYLVVSKKIKLKWYYALLIIIAIIYIVINRTLADTFLGKTVNVTGLMYVKIMLILVGVLIGIFAQGKIQKILMSSTPALIVIVLGLIGHNMNGVLNTAFIIELFVQIILIPKYCMKDVEIKKDINQKK